MPQLGSGILTGPYGPFNAMSAMYLATYTSSAVTSPPTAKLGNTTAEPSSQFSGWQKVGLLQDDDFTVTTAQAKFVEDRRGFKKVLYARAINQAGNATFDSMVVETDPQTFGNITGAAVTAFPTGNPGQQFRVTYDVLYDRTALLYSINAYDGSERYVHIPHVQMTYSLESQKGQNWLIKLSLEALQYAPTGTDYLFEVGRFS